VPTNQRAKDGGEGRRINMKWRRTLALLGCGMPLRRRVGSVSAAADENIGISKITPLRCM
jgi:hypothetical protein